MNQNSKTNDDTIDLKELFFSLIAQWKVIALCVILTLICALLYLRVASPVYSTDAMVQVEDGKSAASAALLGGLKDIPGGLGQKSPADAEIEILNSRLVLGKVIKDLNLDIQIQDNADTFLHRLISKDKTKLTYTAQAVDFQKNQSSFSILKLDIPEYYDDKKLVLKFLDKNQFSLIYQDQVVFKGNLNQLNQTQDNKGLWSVQINSSTPFQQDFTITKLALPSAMKMIQANYSVAEKGKMTGVIGLNYNGNDQQHITQVLNHILGVYHQQNIERKTLESKQTLSFLDQQLPELKQQLEESEIKFNKFREQYNTVDVTQESELMLKQNVELEKMRIELKQKQAEYSAKYTPDHPLMTEINAQLAAIQKKSTELNQAIKRLPETQRLYLQLYRDVKVNTELYTSLLNSYQQLKIVKAGEIGNVRIIDTAVEPVKPIKPRKLIILILSIFVGGFIGVMIALLRNMLSSGIKDSSRIENELDLPVYATVPRSPIQESRVQLLKKKKSIPILAVKNGEDIAIESLRSIRTTIHFALNNAKNNIIAISGPAPEIGKSFISTNLAAIFAQGNKKVLLIDADIRRGYLHKYFDHDTAPGLTEYLTNQSSLEQCIVHSSTVSHLDFLPRGKNQGNAAEMLSSPRFSELLSLLSQQYDHIIIDTPPILAVTDGIIISQFAGVNLVVARYAKTQMKELELTVNRFEQAGSKVNGIILNDVQATAGGNYGYNYAYAYTSTKDD
ncbi:polysaccharide biosynthesis tyrosine autokinase [Acinetobacter bereziniae]|uniref:polysaccharide biosynthesis tyrosine autokinase n=3 Tax=Acinetobacter bereziniae TaxID=106648 RepID=UPI001580B052|nr:polysaccharide biosynthesis tyrosine autokinase [Acinetobacter bereziniae]NUF62063.1 polysaccharide biosynthesis tyrosine autokinase [Acinetobacter bereziniae]NUG63111.1 polysaccharide biosynthesis tyrosine autokinase [Acinetobacter bereziniae]NUG68478.1 polysaccharide biosynthesis tyrosine autokinase [Acinetobacter bereziniae]NUG80104.1 polysaccharide biosynthesis tyrosine autokinase [Acinetobacter bereziniae]